MDNESKHGRLRLRPGELARVKTYEEISACLAENGTLGGLPFQPEMRKYCGRSFRVLRPVKKLLIENIDRGLRGITDAVILDNVTCDGGAHDWCSRTCFVLWKEAWLTRVAPHRREIPEPENSNAVETDIHFDVRRSSAKPCQSIALPNATFPLSAWSIMPYVWDLTDSTLPIPRRLVLMAVALARRIWGMFSSRLPRKSGNPHGKTPTADYDLRPGDIVEVKSLEEIGATLDFFGKNRGLPFIKEMKKFCGRRLRVLKCASQIVIEGTGEVQHLQKTVILREGNCNGSANYSCQRNCYLLWRNVWLKKLVDDEQETRNRQSA
jgi:hypothetical protein